MRQDGSRRKAGNGALFPAALSLTVNDEGMVTGDIEAHGVLLPKLVSGELRLGEAVERLESAA